jgi:uncharacterized membrane protein
MTVGQDIKIYLNPERPENFRVAKSWEALIQNIIGAILFVFICILFVGIFINMLSTKEKKKSNDSPATDRESIGCLVVIIVVFALIGVLLLGQGIGMALHIAEIKRAMIPCTATISKVETGYSHINHATIYQSYIT